MMARVLPYGQKKGPSLHARAHKPNPRTIYPSSSAAGLAELERHRASLDAAHQNRLQLLALAAAVRQLADRWQQAPAELLNLWVGG